MVFIRFIAMGELDWTRPQGSDRGAGAQPGYGVRGGWRRSPCRRLRAPLVVLGNGCTPEARTLRTQGAGPRPLQ